MMLARHGLVLELALLLFVATTAFAQTVPRITISGRVVDDSTSASLENVNVFIAHTTWGASTDQYGRFEIRNVPLASYEIVASRVGYVTRSFRVTLSDGAKRELEIRLHSTTIRLGEVEVVGADPVEWRKQLLIFTPLFLGRTQNAQQCEILNPEVLDFSAEGDMFNATARAPLQIDNLALGYHIEFFLSKFRVDHGIGVAAYVAVDPRTWRTFLTVEGLPKYTKLKASTLEEEKRWRKNRVRAFKGSLRHFLVSLFRRELEQEGFILNDGWATEDDILVDGQKPYEKIVRFEGELEVAYTREPIEAGYNLRKRKGAKKSADAQVSWLRLTYERITLISQGPVMEPFPTIVEGYWAWERMADALPLDYEPETE